MITAASPGSPGGWGPGFDEIELVSSQGVLDLHADYVLDSLALAGGTLALSLVLDQPGSTGPSGVTLRWVDVKSIEMSLECLSARHGLDFMAARLEECTAEALTFSIELEGSDIELECSRFELRESGSPDGGQ